VQSKLLERIVAAITRAWRYTSRKFTSESTPGSGSVDTVAWRNAEFQIMLAEFHYPKLPSSSAGVHRAHPST